MSIFPRSSMNRTKIEWTDFSWNPVTGCLNNCWFCYARKIALRFKKNFPRGFKPTFYPERLIQPWRRRKPAKIFVCSNSDLFASWIPKRWRNLILAAAWCCPVAHTFQFLTKFPELIPDIPYPENFWIGTTVTCENEDWKNIEEIKKVCAEVRYVSFEPLLGRLPFHVSLEGIDWIIIGKLTGSKKVELDPRWVWEILAAADQLGIPVFLKNNLLKDHPEFPKRQEFPVPKKRVWKSKIPKLREPI